MEPGTDPMTSDPRKENPIQEEWSWPRFFGGFVSGRRYGKDFAILFRMVVLIIVIGLLVFGGMKLWQTLNPKSQAVSVAPTRTSGDSTISSSGAVSQSESQVTSAETRTTNTTVTNMPFANGVLGQFGSWFKVQGNEDRKESK